MNRCVQCKHEGLESQQVDDEIRIGKRTFTAAVPAMVCPSCGEAYIDYHTLGRFELAVAEALAREGTSSPEAFRFMRKALGMPAVELAELMAVTPETVSRWEHGKLRVERRALALLGALILDRAEGRTAMLDHLQSLRAPHSPTPNHQRLEIVV